jgi:hypothetical protein
VRLARADARATARRGYFVLSDAPREGNHGAVVATTHVVSLLELKRGFPLSFSRFLSLFRAARRGAWLTVIPEIQNSSLAKNS